MMWFLSGALAYAATLVGIIALRRAAREGDRTYPPLDDLERLYAEPDRHCPACGSWLAGNQLFDSPECQWFWLEEA